MTNPRYFSPNPPPEDGPVPNTYVVSAWVASSEQSGYEAYMEQPEPEVDPDKRPHQPATRWASEPPVIDAATATSVIWRCGLEGCDWFHTWTMWPDDNTSVVFTREFNEVVRLHRLDAH